MTDVNKGQSVFCVLTLIFSEWGDYFPFLLDLGISRRKHLNVQTRFKDLQQYRFFCTVHFFFIMISLQGFHFVFLSKMSHSNMQDLDRVICLTQDERTRGNGLQLHQGKFSIDFRKKKFTESVVRHWRRLPMEWITVSGSVPRVCGWGTWV